MYHTSHVTMIVAVCYTMSYDNEKLQCIHHIITYKVVQKVSNQVYVKTLSNIQQKICNRDNELMQKWWLTFCTILYCNIKNA